MEEKKDKLGWIGLWLAITGLVLPILIAIICGVLLDKDVGYLCVLLYVALEISALGCGIAARQHSPGKAALLISAISLVLGILGYGWFGTRSVRGEPSCPQTESVTPSESGS